MTGIKSIKSYVRPDNTAVITCPHCDRQKSVPVESFKGTKSRIKVKCGCKNIFIANIEFRKRVRKRVNLRGTYTIHSEKTIRGNIIVKNLSVDGLEFSSMDNHTFKVDDELTVEFRLDDEQQSEITKDVIVKDVRKYSVGCAFDRSGDLAFNGPLGFYIMS
ncbi:MAG: PilZ domain-containing protein [Desulfobacterales bacterium]|nr:PilZ domain-containing protein [Desulfobacterales bacterium]